MYVYLCMLLICVLSWCTNRYLECFSVSDQPVSIAAFIPGKMTFGHGK